MIRPSPSPAPERQIASRPARTAVRGITLVEVLVAIAIVAVMGGISFFALGANRSAKLRSGAVTVSGAVRTAFAHASGVSKPLRVVLDLDEQRVLIEESSSALAITKNDRTGGAAAATEAERQAQEEAESILKGPRPIRPAFSPIKAFGFDGNADGKELPSGIRFVQVETSHEEEPAATGRAYLYFWPGGQTERAAIQLTFAPKDEDPTPETSITVIVAPLTGRTTIKKGLIPMERPRDLREESERDDTGN